MTQEKKPQMQGHTAPETPAARALDSDGPQLASTSLESEETVSRKESGDSASMRLYPFSQSIVEERELVGKGGMAQIHVGFQESLQRKVALKRPFPENKDSFTVLSLVQEALITGILEHPNIVPVYDLTLSSDEQPMLVMKYIDGQSWTALLRARPSPGGEEWEQWLEAQLQILAQVCNAAHFAHSRGIIHRDLKPENVMLGEFGEVYLLDWGVAVSLYEDEDSLFPLASEQDSIAGTPAYMAPEQTQPGTGKLTEKTDIYLLGSILFEILSGKPPHQSKHLKDSLRKAYHNTEWTLPPEAPEFLCNICNKAMKTDPDTRFGSADQMQQQLQSYFLFRDSMRLSEATDRELLELEVMLEQQDDWEEFTEEERADFEQRFIKCKFGYNQAIDLWDNNKEAIMGLQQTLELRIQFALVFDEVRQASLYYAQLPEPVPALEGAIRQLKENQHRQTREIQTFREMQEKFNPTIGFEFRFHVMMISAFYWVLVSLGNFGFELGTGAPIRLEFAVLFCLGWAGILLWQKKKHDVTIKATAINLNYWYYLLMCAGVMAVNKLCGYWLSLRVEFVGQIELLLLAVLLSAAGMLYKPSILYVSGFFWAGVIGGMFTSRFVSIITMLLWIGLFLVFLILHRRYSQSNFEFNSSPPL